MSLRSAQQYVQVVGTEQLDGEIRVRRMYVSVLNALSTSNVLTKSASNNIVFTGVASGVIEERAASSTLSITDVASAALFNSDRTPSDTIAFVSTATAVRDLPRGVSDTLSFTIYGGRTIEGAPSSTLSLNSTLLHFNYVADRSPAGNTLALTQSVTTLSGLAVDQVLGLTDSVDVRGPILVYVNTFLGIYQHSSTPYHMWVEDTFTLVDAARVPITQVVSDVLTFTHIASISNVFDILSFTQAVSWGFGLDVADDLGLTETMTVQGNFVRTVEHDLGIGHVFTWYEDTPCGRKQYTPFQGENTVPEAPEAPSDTLHDAQGSTSDRFSLYQPPLGVRTSEVVLRAPAMDNRDRNAYTRVSRETRGGKLVVFADPTWPKVRTLAVTITGLKESEVNELQTFLQGTIGQEVGLTDWEGRLWSGVITTPDESATQDSKQQWTVTFQFEGEMLKVEQPAGPDGMAMDLSQSVTAVIV